MIDKALLACPIETAKCNTFVDTLTEFKPSMDATDPPVYVISGASTSTKTWEIKDLTKEDHCTIIIKSQCNAPGFSIDAATAAVASFQTDFDIHYYEYNY